HGRARPRAWRPPSAPGRDRSRARGRTTARLGPPARTAPGVPPTRSACGTSASLSGAQSKRSRQPPPASQAYGPVLLLCNMAGSGRSVNIALVATANEPTTSMVSSLQARRDARPRPMDHHHHHDHPHHHHGAEVPAPGSHQTAFAVGVLLNLGFAAVELGVGFWANSLALISDALHNFSDVVGLLLAWGAAWLATWRPTASHTHGYRRVSILAALGNAALLFAAVGAIMTEAVRRLFEPAPVAAGLMLWVAALGIVINAATAFLFMRGRHRDLNIRGAFL